MISPAIMNIGPGDSSQAVSFLRSLILYSSEQELQRACFLLASTSNPPQLGQGCGKGFFQEANSHSG